MVHGFTEFWGTFFVVSGLVSCLLHSPFRLVVVTVASSTLVLPLQSVDNLKLPVNADGDIGLRVVGSPAMNDQTKPSGFVI